MEYHIYFPISMEVRGVVVGQNEVVINVCKKYIQSNPDTLFILLLFTFIYSDIIR